MQHVVIIPDNVISKRLSAVEMARRLADAGYSVTFVGDRGDYSHIGEFDYIRLDSDKDRLGVNPQKAAEATASRLAAILSELAPDLVLVDTELHRHVLSLLESRFPLALFSVFFNFIKQKSMPPLHHDIVPGVGFVGTPFMIEVAWLGFRISKLVKAQRARIKRVRKGNRFSLNNYANSLGLQLKDHVDSTQWLIPFVYKNLPTLVLTASEMEFPFHSERTVTYVGPMNCQNRVGLPFLPTETEDNNDYRLNSPLPREKRRPLIYCSFGCFYSGDDKHLWQRIALALGNTDFDVVFALGNRLQPEALGPLPPNIQCLGFAPQIELLEMADCAIIHAGMISVYECIYSGTPMVVYPFDVNDQMGVAARVVYHKIGLRGNRRKDTPASIKRLVSSAMSDKSLKQNIARMRAAIDRYESDNVVAQAVGRVIADAG